jgi:hypothetical protein
MDKQQQFIEAVTNNDINAFKKLIKDKDVNPQTTSEKKHLQAIIIASEYGCTEVIELLLKDTRVDPSCASNFSIIVAAQYGYSDTIKLLLKDSRVNPAANCNYPIRHAYNNKHFTSVKILWDDQRVKNTLKNDHKEIFIELSKQYIKEKIENF